MTTRGRLALALLLVSLVAAIEFWGSVRSGSLALLTDAVHVCMDVLTLAIAMIALIGSRRPATQRKTFGYGRVEILGALLSGSVLLTVTGFIAFQAVQRFHSAYHPAGVVMTIVAAVGLAMNAAVGALLVHGSHDNLNVRTALFHVAGDALGALAVIIGGAAIALTGAAWIDPALSLFVAAIIVAGMYHVLGEAADVLLEGVPRGLHVEDVRASMACLPGILAVHDLHVWTIGSAGRALSAHVLVEDRRVSEATHILREVDAMVRAKFGISHVTLQFECENCAADERVVCTQPLRTDRGSQSKRA
ncbi:MAG TPA: cation diffusion facilitator family transporter [Candidatus Baltobacteraceae bacterium]|nr:cation diffusion facilitator family transporter [Candidatus Baltobacteraceae bacterium]